MSEKPKTPTPDPKPKIEPPPPAPPPPTKVELPAFNTGNDLIRLANKFYPDDAIIQAWDFEKEIGIDHQGDGLALFLAREIFETFEEGESCAPAAKIENAGEYLMNAVREIQSVVEGFSDYLFDYLTAKCLVFELDLMEKSGDPFNRALFNAWALLLPRSMREYKDTVETRLNRILPGWDQKPPTREEIEKVLENLKQILTIPVDGSDH